MIKRVLLAIGVWVQSGLALDGSFPPPVWKLGFGPCLIGAGDLIGGSVGAGLQWNRRYWGWGFESRFQSVTWVVDAGDTWGKSTPYKIYKQHNGFQQDFEVLGRLPLGRYTFFAGGGPSLVYFQQLTQDWVSGNTIPTIFFRHFYSSFRDYGLGYHYEAGLDVKVAGLISGTHFKMSNYGGTKTVFSINLKAAREFGGKP